MPMNYNLEDDDELLNQDLYEEPPETGFAPVPAAPTPQAEPLPNTPRNPDDPQQKIKDYFARQDRMSQQNRAAGREEAELYRKGNADISFGQLLNQSANQFGNIGGKAASSAPLDKYADALKQGNLQNLQLAQGERRDMASDQDRKLKIMEYMRRQGVQDTAAKSRDKLEGIAERTIKLKEDQFAWDQAHPKASTEPGKNRDFEFKLAKDYASDPTTKNTAIIRQSVERARAVASPNSEGKHLPGNDMSLVYSLMKANDPPSTVREGEFQMGTNLGGVDDKILSLRNKILDGTMDDSIRKGILSSIETLAEAQEKSQQDIDAQYEQQAKKWNVDPEMIIGKRKSRHVAAPEKETAGKNAPPVAAKAPAGPLKPLHQMTREEKQRELEAEGD